MGGRDSLLIVTVLGVSSSPVSSLGDLAARTWSPPRWSQVPAPLPSALSPQIIASLSPSSLMCSVREPCLPHKVVVRME